MEQSAKWNGIGVRYAAGQVGPRLAHSRNTTNDHNNNCYYDYINHTNYHNLASIVILLILLHAVSASQAWEFQAMNEHPIVRKCVTTPQQPQGPYMESEIPLTSPESQKPKTLYHSWTQKSRC